MALNAYLKLKGKKQGDIKGSVTQKGRENMIAVHAYNHQIISPRDPASGMATGKRKHDVFTIIKETDRSTPLLFSAFTDNETFSSWELRCFAPNASGTAGTGVEVNHFTIILKNAAIAGIRSMMENNLRPDESRLPAMEEVSFTYQAVEWTWTDGGISATDNWAI